jgi:hypothetical protein
MTEQHELREMWDGYGSDAPAPKPEKPKKQEPKAAEPAPAMIAEAAPVEQDNRPKLRDLSTESIASTFRELAARAREDKKPFEETLAALQEMISKCHVAGLTQVGVTQAGFDTLKDLKLIKDGASAEPPDVHYALLSIDDVRILVRVMPEKIIDCYNENINKSADQTRYLDSGSFWDKTERDGSSVYRRFDLSKEQDQIKLIEAIVITAANTGALQELRQYDTPAKPAQPLAKPRGPK